MLIGNFLIGFFTSITAVWKFKNIFSGFELGAILTGGSTPSKILCVNLVDRFLGGHVVCDVGSGAYCVSGSPFFSYFLWKMGVIKSLLN